MRATDKAMGQCGNGMTECDCCGKPLAWGKTVWLEFDQRVNAFHDYGNVPADYSQGMFPFGPACAARLLQEAREAATKAGVFLGRKRIGKLAQCEIRMAARRPATGN